VGRTNGKKGGVTPRVAKVGRLGVWGVPERDHAKEREGGVGHLVSHGEGGYRGRGHALHRKLKKRRTLLLWGKKGA